VPHKQSAPKFAFAMVASWGFCGKLLWEVTHHGDYVAQMGSGLWAQLMYLLDGIASASIDLVLNQWTQHCFLRKHGWKIDSSRFISFGTLNSRTCRPIHPAVAAQSCPDVSWPWSHMAVVLVETKHDDGSRHIQSPMKFKASVSWLEHEPTYDMIQHS
jgi:hypothetical protein